MDSITLYPTWTPLLLTFFAGNPRSKNLRPVEIADAAQLVLHHHPEKGPVDADGPVFGPGVETVTVIDVDRLRSEIVAYLLWLVVDLPLWKILVNWDDGIPNIWKNKSHVPNHQPVFFEIWWISWTWTYRTGLTHLLNAVDILDLLPELRGEPRLTLRTK